MTRLLLVLFIVLCLLLIAACQQTPSAEQQYLTRLANVLDVEPVQISLDTNNLPSKRALLLRSPSAQLSIREFLSLRECELHLVLAQRNSLLGKAAPNSQLLVSDLAILDTIPDCLEVISDKTLKQKLHDYYQSKLSGQGISWWNAIMAEKEWQSLWRRRDTSLDYPEQRPNGLIEALEELRLLMVNDERQIESTKLEALLSKIRLGDAGLLVSAFQQLDQKLDIANSLIQARLDKPLCLKRQPTDQARYFQNVVNQFFIDGVQRKAVVLERRAQAIMPRINALESQFETVAPNAYWQWRQQRNHNLQRARESVRRHALLIQQLFEQCGLSVGNQPHHGRLD